MVRFLIHACLPLQPSDVTDNCRHLPVSKLGLRRHIAEIPMLLNNAIFCRRDKGSISVMAWLAKTCRSGGPTVVSRPNSPWHEVQLASNKTLPTVNSTGVAGGGGRRTAGASSVAAQALDAHSAAKIVAIRLPPSAKVCLPAPGTHRNAFSLSVRRHSDLSFPSPRLRYDGTMTENGLLYRNISLSSPAETGHDQTKSTRAMCH